MADQRRYTHDVFLSHSSHDKSTVDKVARWLRRRGLRVWYDTWSILPGASIPSQIDQGLIHSRTCLVFLSPAGLKSDWALLERSIALFRDPSNKRRRLLPVLLAPCTIPPSLQIYRYVDFRGSSRAAYAQLWSALTPVAQGLRREYTAAAPRKRRAKSIVVHHLDDDVAERFFFGMTFLRELATIVNVSTLPRRPGRSHIVVQILGRHEPVELHYKFYSDGASFAKSLARSADARQVVVTDLMIAHSDGRFDNEGAAALSLAARYIPISRRFVLSAYPSGLTRRYAAAARPANIFLKLIRPEEFAHALIRAIQGWL